MIIHVLSLVGWSLTSTMYVLSSWSVVASVAHYYVLNTVLCPGVSSSLWTTAKYTVFSNNLFYVNDNIWTMTTVTIVCYSIQLTRSVIKWIVIIFWRKKHIWYLFGIDKCKYTFFILSFSFKLMYRKTFVYRSKVNIMSHSSDNTRHQQTTDVCLYFKLILCEKIHRYIYVNIPSPKLRNQLRFKNTLHWLLKKDWWLLSSNK